MDVASNLLKEANTLAWQPIGEEVSIILYFRPDVKKHVFWAYVFIVWCLQNHLHNYFKYNLNIA